MTRLGGWLVGLVVLVAACDSAPGSLGIEPAPPTQAQGSETAGPRSAAAVLPEDLLLPNMRSVGATDLQVVLEAGERRLRFAGTLANLGAGPMVVRPRRRGECRPGRISVRQIIYRDTHGDGTFQRSRDPAGMRRDAGCMLDHRGHDHWHFDAMASYSLQRRDGRVLVERDKVSFCLRDNARAPRAGFRVRRSYFGECTRRSDQGISPGWVDVYSAGLDGQYLTLPPRMPRGTVCLVVAADPHDQLVETDETDNAKAIPLRIRGMGVRRVKGGCGGSTRVG